MNIEKVNLVYFSATNTTKKVLHAIADGIGLVECQEYDITQGQIKKVEFTNNELVVFGVPVFSGRIPELTITALNKFIGDNTPAIVVCLYGNRDYDDALLELRNTIAANNYTILSAGAFIGQHSIFPQTASNRPDPLDLDIANKFGEQSLAYLAKYSSSQEVDLNIPEVIVKGDFPYRKTKPIPLKPSTNRSCILCGKCARNCPTQAIPLDNPRKTDSSLCISCGRCIFICPENSRNFRGLTYQVVSKKFNRDNIVRKEPELFFPSLVD